MYIYQADLYCDDCAHDIMEQLKKAGKGPKDPEDLYSYDSNDYPKYVRKEESDCPEHCAAGEDCLNVEILSDRSKVGYFFGNPLTTEGYEYVKETLAESIENNIKSVAIEIWGPFYGLTPPPFSHLPQKKQNLVTGESEGELIEYAWPGGYPIIYLTSNNTTLCPDCANNSWRDPSLDIDERANAYFIHYEGPPIWCDDCQSPIESAYGDSDLE